MSQTQVQRYGGLIGLVVEAMLRDFRQQDALPDTASALAPRGTDDFGRAAGVQTKTPGGDPGV